MLDSLILGWLFHILKTFTRYTAPSHIYLEIEVLDKSALFGVHGGRVIFALENNLI